MSTTYDGALGTTVDVRPVGSNVTVGFDTTIVYIGPDTTNASANNHEPIFLEDKGDAEDEFGSDSDLVGGFVAGRNNGAGQIYGISVDGSAADPDYTAAAEAAMSVNPRYICPLTADDTNISDVRGVVTSRATDLEFTRVISPADDVAVADISTYSPRDNTHRYVEVAPSTCTVAGEDTFVAAALTGAAARKPLGASLAYDTLDVDNLGVEYQPSEATDFENVTAVTKDGTVVDGVTTSTESAFSDIFQMEIVDTAALGIDEIAQDYAGDAPNTEDDRAALASDVRIYLRSLASQRPPLLADASGGEPFSVQSSLGANDDTATLNVGIDPVDVMKQIDINLSVGSVITFDGVEA